MEEKYIKRFWSKVKMGDPDKCWEWTGAKCRGYGIFHVKEKCFRSPRLAWELTHESILDNLQVLHTCDNPSCVNPNHLFLGTHSDNMHDMYAKNRGNRPRLFSADQVKEIRNLYASGQYSYRDIGKIFGVGHSEIGQIIRREIWKASF